MKITKLNNTLSKVKKRNITFYADCCCCCCCCILIPFGNLSAEAIVKSVYQHSGKIRKHAILNLLFFIVGLGASVVVFFFFESILNRCRDSLCKLSTIYFGGGAEGIMIVGSGLLVYFLLLLNFAKKWLSGVSFEKRLRATVFQFIISVIFILIFTALSVYGLFGIGEIF